MKDLRLLLSHTLRHSRPPRYYCQHRFQFVDGYSIHVWVYRTRDFTGTPVETREARPLWVPVAEIPYHEMWEDDRHWLPSVIDGRRFQARWLFDAEVMLDSDIQPDGCNDSWATPATPALAKPAPAAPAPAEPTTGSARR